jgi:hypothetical protein
MTTTTIDVSDDYQPESRWAAFAPDDHGKLHHIGQINKIAALQVPDRCHEILNSPRRNSLFLTSKGHWATTLEAAADLLTTKPCSEFVVTGGLLNLFPFLELDYPAKPWSDYLVSRNVDGGWGVEEITLITSESNYLFNSCY